MASTPNILSRFWQELKRRNVVRVVTVYAGAAFVIIELINNITEPLHLPEWTPTLVIVLLAIGFPVVIIFSWIYDIHPEGGMVKTEPAHKVKQEDIPISSNSWKIASYISFVVIVGLIVLNIVPRTKSSVASKITDKSIAVLPFINDSEDIENEHLISGIMEDLLINLQSIKELRVPGRTSTEQYRDNLKPIPEIAAEMKVAYIVEGSGQRYGDKIRLRVQLVEGATDKHIWAASYDEVINGPEDIFRIQSEIAESIAEELQAVITPVEKELIEKVPTTSISALDLYQRGNEAYWRSWENWSDKALENAEYFFNEALKYDSTFAQAYTGLARVYWGSEGYFSEDYLDTFRILVDKALSFDPGLAEAHTLKARFLSELNDNASAMREVDRAISLNPNDWEAYSIKADISTDYINRISNCEKAVLLNRGPGLPRLLHLLGNSYFWIGFFEKAGDVYEERLKLTGDSAWYFMMMGWLEDLKGNTTAAIAQYENALALDSTNIRLFYSMFYDYSRQGEKEQALKYGAKWIELMKAAGWLGRNDRHRVGYYYWLKGLDEEADYYFNLQIDYGLREIELQRNRAEINLNTYYDLAATYAFTGETEKAIENLRIWLTRPVMDANIMWFFRTDPLFNPIRDNPDFQQIMNEAEAKYQAEHERVRQWLEENGML